RLPDRAVRVAPRLPTVLPRVDDRVLLEQLRVDAEALRAALPRVEALGELGRQSFDEQRAAEVRDDLLVHRLRRARAVPGLEDRAGRLLLRGELGIEADLRHVRLDRVDAAEVLAQRHEVPEPLRVLRREVLARLDRFLEGGDVLRALGLDLRDRDRGLLRDRI